MITENLETLKIHKLTQAQYERELEAGNIDENALYLTPTEEMDYATNDDIDEKINTHSSSTDSHNDIRERIRNLEENPSSAIDIVSDEDVLNALIEIDALSVITDNDNAIFVDENNNILMW